MSSWLVIGAGAAGCAVAAELVARGEREIVVVEAGADHPPAVDDHGPLVDRAERRRLERIRRRPGMPIEGYEQGLGVGGSSLVNAGLLDGGPPAGMPSEAATPTGPIGRALLASTVDASVASLVRRDGRRVTAADALLRPLLDTVGDVELRTGVAVDRIRLSGRRATGVVTTTGDVIAADQVVVCAGAIRTPAILLRSGVDAPELGVGAQDHPTAALTLRLIEPADPSIPVVSVVARIGDHHVVALERLPRDARHGALVTALLDVRSRGRVVLDTDGEPIVELGQYDVRADLDRLADAVATTIGWTRSEPFVSVAAEITIDEHGTPLSTIAGDDDRVRDWLLGRPTGHRHISSTCREGVTTIGGRVGGYEALAVADASVFPAVPHGNPYAAVIEQARRIAAGLVVSAA